MRTCPECGSEALSWDWGLQSSNPAVQDGRLSYHDIFAVLVLGCDECSETVEVKHLAVVVQEMNGARK